MNRLAGTFEDSTYCLGEVFSERPPFDTNVDIYGTRDFCPENKDVGYDGGHGENEDHDKEGNKDDHGDDKNKYWNKKYNLNFH